MIYHDHDLLATCSINVTVCFDELLYINISNRFHILLTFFVCHAALKYFLMLWIYLDELVYCSTFHITLFFFINYILH